MIKTEQEIVTDIYHIVKDDPLGQGVSGDVYRPKQRPYGSKAEDIVIRFLSGMDEQIQTGVVILNIYVPDVILPDGRTTIDFRRVQALQREVLDMIDRSRGYEYRFTTDNSMTTLAEEEIQQHYINARLRFQRLSD